MLPVQADLWSVGAILYELVVGRPPYNGGNHVQLLRNIERADARLPDDVRAALSPAAIHIISQAHSSSCSAMTRQPVCIVQEPVQSTLPQRTSCFGPGLGAELTGQCNFCSCAKSKVALRLPSSPTTLCLQLLRRNPVERISFDEFFRHPFLNPSGVQSLHNPHVQSQSTASHLTPSSASQVCLLTQLAPCRLA